MSKPRLPKSFHEMARKLIKEERISVNHLTTLAQAEKISALKTEEYFQERAKGSSRAKFEHAMSQVAKVEPQEFDRLPTK